MLVTVAFVARCPRRVRGSASGRWTPG